MKKYVKYILRMWLRHEKNVDSFSPSYFMIYFTVLFTAFIVIIIFIANITLFYVYFIPLYDIEYILAEDIALIVFAVIISLFVGYISGLILKELFISYSKISKLSRIDCLSGLLNHSAFISNIGSYSGKLSIVFFDIDCFKQINDNFGHSIGDQVITFFSHQLVLIFSKPMFVGRLGGEEFAAAAIGYSEKEAAILADNLRKVIENSCINISYKQSINITISAGVAERFNKEPISIILHQSDQALYVAKKSGRNRVICFSEI
ncbi:MAG: GGDEF domain-containing protein [Candidatus Liberibacter europaeus]|nr:GGDEF domain-containing protein [Candidatus Liberibacter europaeus]